ncbi:hypothetical protein JW868_02425 [Candidatus Woesearchaeota archaeon]|nr:hypothetical protein [Candidatus Woesearchaeota archaeon]
MVFDGLTGKVKKAWNDMRENVLIVNALRAVPYVMMQLAGGQISSAVADPDSGSQKAYDTMKNMNAQTPIEHVAGVPITCLGDMEKFLAELKAANEKAEQEAQESGEAEGTYELPTQKTAETAPSHQAAPSDIKTPSDLKDHDPISVHTRLPVFEETFVNGSGLEDAVVNSILVYGAGPRPQRLFAGPDGRFPTLTVTEDQAPNVRVYIEGSGPNGSVMDFITYDSEGRKVVVDTGGFAGTLDCGSNDYFAVVEYAGMGARVLASVEGNIDVECDGKPVKHERAQPPMSGRTVYQTNNWNIVINGSGDHEKRQERPVCHEPKPEGKSGGSWFVGGGMLFEDNEKSMHHTGIDYSIDSDQDVKGWTFGAGGSGRFTMLNGNGAYGAVELDVSSVRGDGSRTETLDDVKLDFPETYKNTQSSLSVVGGFSPGDGPVWIGGSIDFVNACHEYDRGTLNEHGEYDHDVTKSEEGGVRGGIAVGAGIPGGASNHIAFVYNPWENIRVDQGHGIAGYDVDHNGWHVFGQVGGSISDDAKLFVNGEFEKVATEYDRGHEGRSDQWESDGFRYTDEGYKAGVGAGLFFSNGIHLYANGTYSDVDRDIFDGNPVWEGTNEGWSASIGINYYGDF